MREPGEQGSRQGQRAQQPQGAIQGQQGGAQSAAPKEKEKMASLRTVSPPLLSILWPIIADFGAKYKPGLGAALKLLIFSSVSFTIH